jgi:hypothetical protein
MKYKIIIFALCCGQGLFGQNTSEEVFVEDSIVYEQSALNFQYQSKEYSAVPLSKVFYRMGANVLYSFTYNYGLNYGIAALGSYGIVESGIDWQWNRMAYNNKWIAFSGTPFGAIGYMTPIGLYVYERKHEDRKLRCKGTAKATRIVFLCGSNNFVVKVNSHADNADLTDYLR